VYIGGIKMYKEKSFKRTIIIFKIRRYLFIYFFVALGLVGAWFGSRTFIELLGAPTSIVPYVMAGVGVAVFLIAFILSSNVSFKVKQAQLEMEIYNKLRLNTAMLTKLLEINGISLNQDNPLVDSTDMVPVKTSKPIPKELIFKCMEEINKVIVNQSIKIGDVVIENILDTGADVVATRNVDIKQ